MKLYITTAIDYVNSLPHIGTAYEKIGADVLARWHKLKGDHVRLQMGNDEHSTNVIRAAEKQGMKPREYCNMMRARFEDVWKRLDVLYDDFIQTSEDRHYKAVQKLFERIKDAGDIYKAKYTGLYCESCEAYVTEKDLVDGLCPRHKQKPHTLSEENYFFALSKYADRLKKYIGENPDFILPQIRRREILNVIEDGLQDISISREGERWGIPVPGDETQRVYVWFDALINYISAVGYGSDGELFGKWWPADHHVIGKDITRFHCIIWPAMLMSAGVPLPRSVFGHGFVSFKGEKMSKTLGNVVAPLDVADKYGSDSLRYYLLREGGFGRDSDFTWENFIRRYNDDLADGLGNLTSRSIGMIARYFDSNLPRNPKAIERLKGIEDLSAQVDQILDWKNDEIGFHQALAKIWDAMSSIDKFINDNKPWEMAKLKKTDELRLVLQAVMEGLCRICVLVWPFMPSTAAKMWSALGFAEFGKIEKMNLKGGAFSKSDLSFKVSAISLFPRIEPLGEKEKGEAVRSEVPKMTEVQKVEGLDIADFAKIDLRVAKIVSAERVEGADKLLKIMVDLGTEQRQIVAGIAKHYVPEDLVGKSVVVVANLKPAKLRGVESNGMLLAASLGENLTIISPAKDIEPGAKVK